jgi:hypothetical protein
MAFKINPPSYILSKLGIKSIDEIGKDEDSFRIEIEFPPAEKYTGDLHSEKFYKFHNSTNDFYWNKKISTYSVSMYSREMLKNSIYHGPRDRFIFLGAYLTLDIKIVACNDGGDYFKNTSIKEAWENKVKLKKEQRHDAGTKLSGYGFGQEWMFNKLNEIHVDTNQGTLYFIQPVQKPADL